MDQLSEFHPDVLGSDEQFGHATVLFDPCPRLWRNPARHSNDLFVVPAQCRTGAGLRRLPGSLEHYWWATVQGTGVENRFTAAIGGSIRASPVDEVTRRLLGATRRTPVRLPRLLRSAASGYRFRA